MDVFLSSSDHDTTGWVLLDKSQPGDKPTNTLTRSRVIKCSLCETTRPWLKPLRCGQYVDAMARSTRSQPRLQRFPRAA
jgi:hypothetical protein